MSLNCHCWIIDTLRSNHSQSHTWRTSQPKQMRYIHNRISDVSVLYIQPWMHTFLTTWYDIGYKALSKKHLYTIVFDIMCKATVIFWIQMIYRELLLIADRCATIRPYNHSGFHTVDIRSAYENHFPCFRYTHEHETHTLALHNSLNRQQCKYMCEYTCSTQPTAILWDMITHGEWCEC